MTVRMRIKNMNVLKFERSYLFFSLTLHIKCCLSKSLLPATYIIHKNIYDDSVPHFCFKFVRIDLLMFLRFFHTLHTRIYLNFNESLMRSKFIARIYKIKFHTYETFLGIIISITTSSVFFVDCVWSEQKENCCIKMYFMSNEVFIALKRLHIFGKKKQKCATEIS